jgi:hypothetical protein
MTNIISVSIPNDLAEFLDENDEISPSKIIQSKLYEMKNDEARIGSRLKAAEIRCIRLSEKLNKVLRWCEEQNIVIPDNVLV